MSKDAGEEGRLAALRSYRILDTPPEPEFDAIVREAAAAFSAPMAVMSLVDENRQWRKAMVGLEGSETERSTSFCTHTIRSAAMFVVQDATSDPRFASNPFVTGEPHIRFYAGTTLTSEDGHRIGTLCVIDTVPRDPPNAAERGTLIALADRVMAALNARKRRLEEVG